MRVFDLDGQFETADEIELIARLRSVRRGAYGAFLLSHADEYPYMSVHFNGDLAYIGYYPSEGHPPYVPSGMSPVDSDDDVRFALVGGTAADDIYACAQEVIPDSLAIRAACQFLASDAPPDSIKWQEP
jgi:hypothetical protein